MMFIGFFLHKYLAVCDNKEMESKKGIHVHGFEGVCFFVFHRG